jgi:5-methylcytosine-specific restriction endonuclease McrA
MFCSIQCHAKYRNKGLSSENSRIRVTKEYIEWRKNVFRRDDFTCQLCGIKGVTLNADHIKSFSGHPELRFELSNGRTLCIACHKKTDNYGSKARLKK